MTDLRYASLSQLCKMANDYLDSHTFPSGLHIDLYTSAEQYPQELRKCSNQTELDAHIVRWKYLLPELRDCKPAFADMQKAVADHAYQNQLAEAKDTNILNVLMPPTWLRFMLAAVEFQVPIGVVIFQLWNAGKLTNEGTWIIPKVGEPENSPTQEQPTPPTTQPSSQE